MKNKLLRLIFMLSRFTLYGMVLQACFLQLLFAAEGKAQRYESAKEVYIAMDMRNATLGDVLRNIESKTDFRFTYDKKDVNENLMLNIKTDNQSVADILIEVSRQTRLRFKQVNNVISVQKNNILSKGNSMEIVTMEKTITGRVTDESSEPLPGVNILLKGTTTGTITDVDGNYRLTVPDDAATLVFSSVGYETEEINIGNQTVIDIQLTPDVQALSEIVVIGYGEREKKDLTGAISNVGSEDIEKAPAMTPELALQGKVTGVRIFNRSGAPNARPQIRIRGVGTLNNANPLYVVDGMLIEEFGDGTEDASGSRTADLRGNVNLWTLIDPDDIESISVLKDASAAAIYGSRAANGVILITTKKGKAGRTKVDFNMHYGIQNIPTYDLLNVSQYTGLYQEAYNNNPNSEPLPGVFHPDSANALGIGNRYLGNSSLVDWQRPLLNKNAVNQDYNVRVHGGTENTTFYVSAGYQNQESTFIQNQLERYSLATNIDSKIGQYIKVGLTYRLSYGESLDNTQGTLDNAVSAPPWQPIVDPSNKWGFAPTSSFYDADGLYPIDNNGTFVPRLLYGPETETNIYGFQRTQLTEYTLLRNIGKAFLEIEPLSGLKIRGTLSADWTYNRRNSYNHIENYLFSITPGDPAQVGDGNSLGGYGERHSRNINIQKDLMVNYIKSFGNHGIDLLFNATDQRFEWEGISGSTEQLNTEDLDRVGVGGPNEYVRSFTDRARRQWIGYVGRLSYNYDSRYYLDVSVRRDASSGFAEEYRWGTFPAFSAAWRVSSEPFMETIPFINDLKIRGGWGKAGNDDVADFAYLSLVSTTPDYSFGSGPGNGIGTILFGARLPNFPIRDLTWEVATSSNIGFDGVFFNNHLNLTVDFYKRLVTDILQTSQLPRSVGNEVDPTLNIASVKNTGIEITAGYNGSIGNFQYNVSGNISTVRNRVVEVFNNQPFGGEFGRIEEGFPLSYLWMWQMGGIFQTQAEVDQWQQQFEDTQAESQSPGDIYFEDVHGDATEDEPFYSKTPDGVVNLSDRTYVGKTIPGFTYGLNLGASFKGFDANISFYGEGDVQKYNSARAKGESMSSTGINQWTTVLNRWTEVNPSTSMPRAVRNDPAGNNRSSNRFVEDADFFRLNVWQLGYSLPKNALDALGFVERLRMYVGGQNNFTITGWSGLDPINDNFPLPRTFLVGVDATF